VKYWEIIANNLKKADWQRCQVISERLHERQHDSPAGLASSERNLAAFKIHCAPCEARQVAESLAEIQTEKHKAASFGTVTARF
jgi:hypothetical protein